MQKSQIRRLEQILAQKRYGTFFWVILYNWGKFVDVDSLLAHVKHDKDTQKDKYKKQYIFIYISRHMIIPLQIQRLGQDRMHQSFAQFTMSTV